VKGEEFDYFHDLIVTQEMVRANARGFQDGSKCISQGEDFPFQMFYRDSFTFGACPWGRELRKYYFFSKFCSKFEKTRFDII
jgi:hypothetical protein